MPKRKAASSMAGRDKRLPMVHDVQDQEKDEKPKGGSNSKLVKTCLKVLQELRLNMADESQYKWPQNENSDVLGSKDKDLLWDIIRTLNKDSIEINEGYPEDVEKAQDILRRILPKIVEDESADDAGEEGATDINEISEWAFEGIQMADRVAIRPSKRLCKMIMQYADIFYAPMQRVRYHAPYVSVVGPSGSGKSFGVKKLAEDENLWVIYASLSDSAQSMPRPGSLKTYMEACHDAKAVRRLWNHYIRASLRLVLAAQVEGMTPAMLFRLQYHEMYAEFRARIAALVGSGKARYSKAALAKALRETVDLDQLWQWEKARPRVAVAGEEDGDADQKNGTVVFCFDEARYLLDTHPDKQTPHDQQPVAFRQLRHALADGRNLTGSPSLRIFGVFLDTLSRVHNFSPPVERDPSLKDVVGYDLFPPLYGVHATWDAMALHSPPVQTWLRQNILSYTDKDSSDGNQDSPVLLLEGPRETAAWDRFFCSLGRPLWGGILEASLQHPLRLDSDDEDNDGETIEEMNLKFAVRAVRDLARAKLDPRPKLSPTETYHRHMALLMFRLRFYLADHRLSEACVSDWLHYVRSVSSDRATVQTMQPNEPILAQDVALRMKMSPSLRAAMVSSLAQSLHSGALNVGDAGEVVAGLLLLIAFDTVPQTPDDGPGLPLHKDLGAFLRTFVGWDMGIGPFARVHVSHIGRLNLYAESGITQQHLQVAFLTGEAWFLPAGFPGADMLVPVWQGPSKPMTALLIQVKNKDGPNSATAKVKLEARTSLAFARSSITALLDPNLPVYGLYINLRVLVTGTETSTLGVALDPSPADGNLPVFVKMGFCQAAYPFLQSEECSCIAGIVEMHAVRLADENLQGLAAMEETRSGSSFLQE